MMKFMVIGFLTIASCSTGKKNIPNPPPAPEKTENSNKISTSLKSTCSLGSDERIISVITKEPQGCETHYNKDHQEQVQATAKWDLTYCEKIYNLIKTKLEDSGYDCKSN